MNDPRNSMGWDDVTILRKKHPSSINLKKKNPIASSKVESQLKYSEGNKKSSSTMNKRKLDENEDGGKLPEVGLSLGQTIQKARAAKNMKQKDLSSRINEKPSVIADYETGKAIPNNQILGKLERVLGVKLRGKKK